MVDKGLGEDIHFWLFINDLTMVDAQTLNDRSSLNWGSIKPKIYPNPFKHYLVVETEDFDYRSIRIVNIDGREVFQAPIRDKVSKFDLKDLPAGVYTIILKDKTGMMRWSEKLIRMD